VSHYVLFPCIRCHVSKIYTSCVRKLHVKIQEMIRKNERKSQTWNIKGNKLNQRKSGSLTAKLNHNYFLQFKFYFTLKSCYFFLNILNRSYPTQWNWKKERNSQRNLQYKWKRNYDGQNLQNKWCPWPFNKVTCNGESLVGWCLFMRAISTRRCSWAWSEGVVSL